MTLHRQLIPATVGAITIAAAVPLVAFADAIGLPADPNAPPPVYTDTYLPLKVGLLVVLACVALLAWRFPATRRPFLAAFVLLLTIPFGIIWLVTGLHGGFFSSGPPIVPLVLVGLGVIMLGFVVAGAILVKGRRSRAGRGEG